MRKILLFSGIGLVVVILVTFVTGIFIGPIIKAGVEKLGSQITQVPIKVEAVNLSVLSGSGQVKGLIVGNPSGYKTPEAIKLGTASVKLDPFSIFSNKVLVHSIRVESPEITYDGGLGGSNLSTIMNNVNAVARAGGPAPAGASAGTETGKKPAPKIEITDFLITGARVHVNLTGVSSKAMTLSLPDIHLTGLGKGIDGITVTELIRVVLGQVTRATVEVVTGSISSSGQVIQGLGKDVEKDAADNINAIKKGIGGLLGK